MYVNTSSMQGVHMLYNFPQFQYLQNRVAQIEGLSRRKPYVTFHFVIFKIPSFAHVIGFSFIPNIHKIDNKVEEKKEAKKDERSILVISFEPSRERQTDRDRERKREKESRERELRKTENIRQSRKAEWEPT